MSTPDGTPVSAGRAQAASPLFIAMTLLFVWVAAVIFYQPGSIGADPTIQWYEAQTGQINSMHPPFTAFVWHWLGRISPNPGLFLALQLAIFWMAAGVFFHAMAYSRTGVIVGTLLSLVMPFLVAYSAVIMKDVFGGNLALLGSSLVLGYPRCTRKNLQITAAFVCFALAALVRYQLGIVPLVALASLLVFDLAIEKQDRAIALRHGTIAVLSLLIPIFAAVGAMHAVFTINRSSAEQLAGKILLYDIAAAMVYAPDVPLTRFSEQGVDVESLRNSARALYSTERIDYLWKEGGKAEPINTFLTHVSNEDIRAQWLELLRTDPRPFIYHRLYTFLRFMGTGDIWSCYPLSSVGFPLAGAPPSTSHIEAYDTAELWRALPTASLHPAYAVSLLTSKFFPVGSPLFRPMSYLILSVVLVAFFVRNWATGTNVFPLFLIVAAWLYWLSFAAVPAACDVRYSYFPCVAVMVAAAALISERMRRRRAARS